MMRIKKMTQCAVVIVAMAALVGCGSDSGTNGGTTTTTDASGTAADTNVGGSDAGAAEADGTAASDTSNSTGGSPCDKCADNEICENDKCVPKPPPPCGGKCPDGEVCDLTADGGKGKCIKPTCTLPDKFHAETNKISKIEIPSDDKGACDLNDDGKPDNALGKALSAFASQIKSGLDDALVSGDLSIILEPSDYKTDGSDFDMNVLIGAIDPSQVGSDGKPTCDTTKDKCKYQVETTSYDLLFDGKGMCPAVVNFNPSKIDKLTLTAGGPKQVFLLKFPILNFVLEFAISSATLKGTVDDAKNWKSTKDGHLCGMITKEAIDKAIDQIPEEELQKQGFDKATITALVGGVLKPDIDSDENGTNESVSVHILIETIPAEITGVAK